MHRFAWMIALVACSAPWPVTPTASATPEAACNHECSIGCAVGCDPNCATATQQAIDDRMTRIDLDCIVAAPDVETVERCAGVRCE